MSGAANAAEKLFGALSGRWVTFFAGVPDSCLKGFAAVLSQAPPPALHLTAASDGGAVGLAIGHHLATGRPAAVYMQNSGLGNALNPLASLADPLICAVPMLLVVGWRG